MGAYISSDGSCATDVKRRIAMAKSSFMEHKELFKSNISNDTKLRLLNTCVWSILTYGCEAWTICKDLVKKIQSFEYWCYRRILEMSWKEKITNEEVLRRMGTDLN